MLSLNFFAILWFLALWAGYTLFAKNKAKSTLCLASEMRKKRIHWMQQMLARENRIADVSIISTLERNITFFASSSMLIMAGLLTAMTSADKLSKILSDIVHIASQNEQEIQLKLGLLICIFVFAFFQFTWALRQYGFAGILVGAAPERGALSLDQHVQFANRAAKVIDQAAHSFNYGLRAIYFSLAALSWFVDARLFMLASVVVVLVMYQREFHSKVLKALHDCA